MNAHTHVLGGLAAAGIALSLGMGHPVTLVLSSGFGGLIPDWDHPHSTIGRWIPWPALSHSRGPNLAPEVGRRGWPHPIWHRHQAHSLIGSALASLAVLALFAMLAGVVSDTLHLTAWTLPWMGIFGGLFLGCLSHLALDAFNQTPQWWLWPFSHQGFRWPIHAPVKRVDGLASLILTVIVALLAWHISIGHGFSFAGLWVRGGVGR